MLRVIATYAAENSARITATTAKAAGMPVSPVVAYAAGMTPAATVSGATPASTKNSTAGTPSRSRASARETLPEVGSALVNMITLPDGVGDCSFPVTKQGTVRGGLGVRDQLPQAGRKPPGRLWRAAIGGRRVLSQPEP